EDRHVAGLRFSGVDQLADALGDEPRLSVAPRLAGRQGVAEVDVLPAALVGDQQLDARLVAAGRLARGGERHEGPAEALAEDRVERGGDLRPGAEALGQ